MSSQNEIELVIPSDPDQIQVVERKLGQITKKLGLSDDDKDNLAIAVTEVVSNAILHGNKSDKNKKVHVNFIISSEFIKIEVADQGVGFNPDQLANPLDPDNLLKESGRGIFIVRTLMDDVDFECTKNGSKVILIKNI